MILIFGGTTEGRMAVDVCEKAGKRFYYSTKGSLQDVHTDHCVRLYGPMNAVNIESFCNENGIKCIVDAAHPFAAELHRTIGESVQHTHDKIPVIRVQRTFCEHVDGVSYCKDFAEAVRSLCAHPVKCLLALSGVNTISLLSDYWHNHTTFFRVLRRQESINVVSDNGFPIKNVLYYNEDNALPTKEQEKNLMQSIGCDAIITKESGSTGGYDNKIQAAMELGLKIFVVEYPKLPEDWIYVTGKHGLRRAIEHLVPDFFKLKTGFTTGACATAAVKAALLSLLFDDESEEVRFKLPDGETMSIPTHIDGKGIATVIKDYNDDPDVTKGCKITAKVQRGHNGIRFLQGEGVGRVTLPGLGIPVGEPAINPTPRKMITNEIRSISDGDFDITISVEEGRTLAHLTFNPKVGVVDGISIIGTSGIVSPLSNEAFVESIGRELEVAKAIGCTIIGLASGKRGEEAIHEKDPNLRVIHYGNFIGASLTKAYNIGFTGVVIGIMIGKAVKLAEGHLDTHSHKVVMNKEFIKQVALSVCPNSDVARIDSIAMARELWSFMPPVFFDKIKELCYQQCRKVFPKGILEILLICDAQV